MRRRSFLTGLSAVGAGTIAAPALSQSRARTLKFVPQAALASVDPIWTTAAVTRNHGYMVFDSLYGLDASLTPQPQMAAGTLFEDGGTTVTVTLRDGLRFHDGEPVRAVDCVASLRRWMKRSAMGQKLETVTDDLLAIDDRRLRFRLKRPFPLILSALGAIGPQALIMPERLARTDPFQQVREVVGSGPFRFKADEFNSGALAVYERNPNYVPVASGTPQLTAGPKIAHFDRIEWQVIPDAATAAAALQSGEIDWFEQPPPELLEFFKRGRTITVERLDTYPQVSGFRFNQLSTPFNDRKIRQALLPAINQQDFMLAVVGDDRSLWQDRVGFFTPGSPSASTVGVEKLSPAGDIPRARELLKAAGYTDQPMRQLGATDLPGVSALSLVLEDLLRRVGMKNDMAMSDWGTVVQRRASREPLEKGGWSAFCTSFSWFEYVDPAVNIVLRGNGSSAFSGWPSMPEMETLRDKWFDASDDAARKTITDAMQSLAFEELPIIPLGAFFNVTAYRNNIVGRLQQLPTFWNMRRA